jgi:hypothetical protein
MARLFVLLTVSIATFATTQVSFADQYVPCENTRYEYSGEPSSFYISVDEVLAVAEGTFHIPTRWRNTCTDTPRHFSRPAECDNPESIVHDLHNSETVVHIVIAHEGEPAFVRHATESQPVCAEALQLPVKVSIRSDDGVLDEELDLEISTECGKSLGMGFSMPLPSLKGRVNQAGVENGGFEFLFGFFRDRVWLDSYLTLGGNSGWVLTSDLPPFAESPHDIGFADVGLSPDLALADGPCPARERVLSQIRADGSPAAQ